MRPQIIFPAHSVICDECVNLQSRQAASLIDKFDYVNKDKVLIESAINVEFFLSSVARLDCSLILIILNSHPNFLLFQIILGSSDIPFRLCSGSQSWALLVLEDGD